MDYTGSIAVTGKLMDAFANLNALFKKNESVKNSNLQLLEPLTCIIRLAMLNFQEIGTKIAIYNNRISSQLPNIIQGATRWVYGNKRNELHNLYKPILISLKYYDRSNNMDVSTIFDYAVGGLEKLAQTYSEHENDIVCHSIKLYKDILSATKKNKHARINIENQLKEDDITLPLYEQFNQLWNERQITIISALLQEAEDCEEEPEEVNSMLNAIDQLLQVKENSSVKIINTFALNLTKL
tara:strand:+ start:110 stop:829 length:720 start_codon:yes stop_codon:yes gene_type:complete